MTFIGYMRYFVSLIIIIFLSSFSIAQEEGGICEDAVYVDNIHLAHFNQEFGELPVIGKNRNSLLLMFDDFDTEIKDYYYRIFHCDKDWIKSNISEWEFTEGLNDYSIDDYEFDDARYSDYITYSLRIPNENTSFLISGNYILEIWDTSGDEEVLAFTKRFIYSENILLVKPEVKPIQTTNYLHNQEVNFSIEMGRFPMVSPTEETFVSVFQNGSWGITRQNIQPVLIQGTKLKFNLAKPIAFPGLKEYRMFDIRGLKYTSEYVEAIDRHQNGTDVLLKKDYRRHHYFTQDDFNGGFYIYESPHTNEGEEYVKVTFNLDAKVPYDNDVYVYGAFSDWGLKEEFLMKYNEEESIYHTDVMLKQGVYNYLYAIDIDNKVDLETIEGSSGEAENVYNIVVYYRTIGTDYDRVLATYTYVPYF